MEPGWGGGDPRPEGKIAWLSSPVEAAHPPISSMRMLGGSSTRPRPRWWAPIFRVARLPRDDRRLPGRGDDDPGSHRRDDGSRHDRRPDDPRGTPLEPFDRRDAKRPESGQRRPAPGIVAKVRAIGRYQVIRTLGQGAFGVVFLCLDPELGREVAVKVPRAERVRTPEDVESYLQEARLLASLDHPHVLPVYDAGRIEEGEGACFLVAKYVEGTDLKTLMAARRFSAVDSAQLVERIASGLQEAHRRNLIHRDIKPANILIAADGRPYLADFGLAIDLETFRAAGTMAGTPEYMSPSRPEARTTGSALAPTSTVLVSSSTGSSRVDCRIGPTVRRVAPPDRDVRGRPADSSRAGRARGAGADLPEDAGRARLRPLRLGQRGCRGPPGLARVSARDPRQALRP